MTDPNADIKNILRWKRRDLKDAQRQLAKDPSNVVWQATVEDRQKEVDFWAEKAK